MPFRAEIDLLGILGRRKQGQQNDALSQIIQQALQMGQIPEQITDVGGVERQFAGGMSPSAIVGQIQGGTLPQTQNPAYADLIQKILQGSQQFARLGGDPNQLVNVLTKTGVMQTPQERIYTKKAEAELKEGEAERKIKQGRLDETKRRNLVLEQIAKDRAQTYKDATKARTAFFKTGGKPQDRVSQANSIIANVARMQQLLTDETENKNFLRQATNQVLLPEPTVEDAIRAAGYTPALVQRAEAILNAGLGVKTDTNGGNGGDKNAARIKELEAKIDSNKFTAEELAEYEKLTGGK